MGILLARTRSFDAEKERKMSIVGKARLTVWQFTFVMVAVAGVIVGVGKTNAFSQTGGKLEIKTLSSRPDMVSGGDALIEVKAPAGTQLSQLTLTLNGKDVTNKLRLDTASGGFRGLIGGMVIGENTLVANLKAPKPSQASLK